MNDSRISRPYGENLKLRNLQVWNRNHRMILGFLQENSPCTVLGIHRDLRILGSTSGLHRHVIKQHLEELEKENRVHRDGSEWHFGVRPDIVEDKSSGVETKKESSRQHDFSDLAFLREALENGKYCWFFRRTYNPKDRLVKSLDEETYDEEVPDEYYRKSVDEAGRRIGCMYVIADGEWDRLKAHPVTRLKDMFLSKSPYFLDKIISEAVRKKYIDLECFTDNGELRNISDDGIRRLKRLAFGDVEKFIVAFSIYTDTLFTWLRVTPEGREALIEASRSPDVKSEVENRKSYEKMGDLLTEKLGSQDRERARRRSDHK